MAAYEIESYQTDKASGMKSKLPSDILTEPDNAAVLNSFISSTQDYRMISYLSRLNYDYDDRYYLAGSFRRMVVHAFLPITDGVTSGLFRVCGTSATKHL